MKSLVITTHFFAFTNSASKSLNLSRNPWSSKHTLILKSQSKKTHLIKCSYSRSDNSSNSGSTTEAISGASKGALLEDENMQGEWRMEIESPRASSYVSSVAKMNLGDKAFFLLAFVACTTFVAFTSLCFAAVPTLYAMQRAAISLTKLADTAREELPSTMAAIKLSGMEISDLTLELSDLSQEIADGVSKSAQAAQAAEAGIRQIGSLARQQTMYMIQERANLPIISLQPVVAGAAKKTTQAVDLATKTLLNILSAGEAAPENDDCG